MSGNEDGKREDEKNEGDGRERVLPEKSPTLAGSHFYPGLGAGDKDTLGDNTGMEVVQTTDDNADTEIEEMEIISMVEDGIDNGETPKSSKNKKRKIRERDLELSPPCRMK
uniref:Uncharacterized protein n=1 Tax=Cacopsylla melanoneura TaxID=428564 RepID=A0A8D8XI08_9HEMI